MYTKGQGVAQDFEKALKWYRMAVEQGDGQAQFNLGVLYWNGQGVAKDPTKALQWYEKAWKQGYYGPES